MESEQRIGILTGGGDCPGLNAAIRAVTKTAIPEGYQVIGIRNGWQGLLDDDTEVLDRIKTSGIIDRGGTILGTSRTSPLLVEDGTRRVFDAFHRLGLTALVVLGGEGTLSVASKLYDIGLPLVGIPKTIDNDVKGTDYTIGFQTAVEIATEALDRIRTTAESHHRVMLLEVMGRTAGWIAVYAGMANGADAILIPELPIDDEKLENLCQMLLTRKARGANFSIVAVAEGTVLQGKIVAQEYVDTAGEGQRPRLGGVAAVLAEIIEKKTNLETRVSSLGYIQRGGTPSAYDRSLAIAFGVKAVTLIQDGKLGEMTALKGGSITSTPLSKVADGIKPVPLNAYRVAERFFG
ncbi:MAG: 6-phosphofructokinase [Chloroflexi bacterium]|nr:6-phosphofructokinase [Chloroflexota bacterium]